MGETPAAPAPFAPPVTAAGPTPRSSSSTPAHMPWQEDGRFGMVMIAVLVLVNIVLSLTLPLVGPQRRNEQPRTATLSNSTAMPATHRLRAPSTIRIYSDTTPRQAEDGWDLNSLAEDYNHFVTQPESIPAPAARALAEQD